MIKKLYLSLIYLVVFVVIILIGNQIVILQFTNSSNKLVLEYQELYSFQNYKTSILRLITIVVVNPEDDNEYRSNLANAFILTELTRKNCHKEITHKHLDDNWHQSEFYHNHIKELISNYLSGKDTVRLDITAFKKDAELLLNNIDSLIIETSGEIKEIKLRNDTIEKHGSITLITIGSLFVVMLAFGGFRLANMISSPIMILLNATKRVKTGDKEVRVAINTGDEFNELATSFNQMLDNLKETTISLAYVNTIIDNIYGALFVTNLQGEIQTCNKVALAFLGYRQHELINKHISILFTGNQLNMSFAAIRNQKIEELAKQINKATEIYDRSSNLIPIMATCTILTEPEHEGLIIVIHDMTEKVAIEKELSKIRRDSIMAINEAQEAERIRIATELHDSLGQKLSAISFMVQSISNTNSNYTEKIKYVQELTDAAITESRNISHSLIPAVLKDFGLEAALKDLINSTNKIQKTVFIFSIYDWVGKIDAKLELALYRICQEALNNILKHAKAQNATFQLFKKENLVTLMIDDDGIGFDIDSNKKLKHSGIGISTIKERVLLFNGILTINSGLSKGTEIIIEIPIKTDLL